MTCAAVPKPVRGPLLSRTRFASLWATANPACDTSHLVEPDPVHGVARTMVIRVQPGREERHWNPLRRVAVMVAPRVHRFGILWIVELVIELQRRCHRLIRLD